MIIIAESFWEVRPISPSHAIDPLCSSKGIRKDILKGNSKNPFFIEEVRLKFTWCNCFRNYQMNLNTRTGERLDISSRHQLKGCVHYPDDSAVAWPFHIWKIAPR